MIRCGSAALLAKFAELCPEVDVQHVRLWDEGMRSKMEYNLDHVFQPCLCSLKLPRCLSFRASWPAHRDFQNTPASGKGEDGNACRKRI